MSGHLARIATLGIAAMASIAAYTLISTDAGARRGRDDFAFHTTSTSVLNDFFCGFEIALYDPVALTYIRLDPGLWGSCQTHLPGVTMKELWPHGPIVLEDFPDDFRGPATLLECNADYHHSECAPTIEETDLYTRVEAARGENGESIEIPTVCVSHIDCNRWPCDETGPLIADACGDPNRDGVVSATDALIVLHAAVSAEICLPAHCDADRDGSVDASDSLRVLQGGVGFEGVLLCPGPCVPS